MTHILACIFLLGCHHKLSPKDCKNAAICILDDKAFVGGKPWVIYNIDVDAANHTIGPNGCSSIPPISIPLPEQLMGFN